MRNYRLEIISSSLLFLSLIGFVRLGSLGRFMDAAMRVIVGDLSKIGFLIVTVVSIILICTGGFPYKTHKRTLTTAYIILILALGLHTFQFYAVAQSNQSIIQTTWQNALYGFQGDYSKPVGGGILGALCYQATYFALSQLGTILLLCCLVGALICYVFHITLRDIFETLKKVWEQLSQWIKKKYDALKIKVKAQKEKQAKQRSEQKSVQALKESRVESNHQEIKQQEASPVEVEIVGIDSGNREKQTSLQIEEEDSDIDHMLLGGEEENPDYRLPTLSLLNPSKKSDQSDEYATIKDNIKKLEKTFKSFNVEAKVTKANLGPAVTKYEIQPAIGTKVNKITNLSDDIALALAAKDIRIEAPIPGKSLIGIEVPNKKVSLVSYRDIFEKAPQTENKLEVPIGRDISGNVKTADLTKMPHLLVAGSTGSGKSVAVNGMIVSLLMKAKPNELKLMMIDPKKVELTLYNGIPHLLTPVVTNPRKAAAALNKIVEEMERRYELFATTGQRNIDGYNHHVRQMNLENGESQPTLTYIVVIIDELADLMMVASKEVEIAITRLAQMARAAGIHMIIATQRPSVDVITGIIKANIPSRMAFAVSSGTDSRTIIDQNGAEKLLGRGDMLFMPMGEGKPIRVQGAYITDDEVERVVNFVKEQQAASYVEEMMPEEKAPSSDSEEVDEIWAEAIAFIRQRETISISMLQRRFRIGYNRAARIIDDMEQHGYVGVANGSKPREVRIHEETENQE